MSGLISRTVVHPELIAPGAYHGAKFYRELAGLDRTAAFLDAISSRFPITCPEPPLTAPPDAADGRGPRYLAAFARTVAEPRDQRLRAGCGETLRALLRRNPASVYVAADADRELDPVRYLCRERGVPILPLPAHLDGVTAPYRCVGLLRASAPSVADHGRPGQP